MLGSQLLWTELHEQYQQEGEEALEALLVHPTVHADPEQVMMALLRFYDLPWPFRDPSATLP